MAGVLPRNASYICRSCRSRQVNLPLLQHRLHHSEASRASLQTFREQKRAASSRTPTSRPSRIPSVQTPSQDHSKLQQRRTAQSTEAVPKTAPEVSIDAENVRGTLRDIQLQVNAICASKTLPEEYQALEVMDKAYQFANVLVFGQTTAPDEAAINTEEEDHDTQKLLFSDLDEPPQSARKPIESPSATAAAPPTSYRERSAQALCESIYNLLKDPKIMITEPILSTYVRIVCQLGSPEYLPEIFFLYAHKPQPIPRSQPIQYRNPSPNSPKNAIPQGLSDVALDTAILQRDLSLAIAIVDTTVGTRAFRLNKFVRKASLPLALVGSTPIAAYAAADWVANWQNSLDPNMAKAITLMGSAAYIGTLTTIGFVAVTTWNDHHERVRWTEGTPLRYRWTREEERLYFDRIAMAWGFQRKRRRGEEMGELWEELREECGVRGMVLDKSDLLPGMQ